MYINHKRLSALFIFLFSFSFAAGAFAADAAKTDVLAEIAGRNITRADYEAEMANLMKTANPQTKDFFATAEGKRAFLNQLLEVFMLDKKAADLGFYKGEKYEQALREASEGRIATEIMREKVEAAAVSDDEVKTRYEATKSSFKTPAKYHIFQISVKTKQKAEELKKAIEGGKSFLETAKDNSSDGFKASGGDRGFIAEDALEREVMLAVSALKPNELSKPVEIDEDLYLLVKYTEKEESKIKELSDAAPQIRSELLNIKQKEAYENQLEFLKKDVGMVVNQDVVELLRKETLTDEEKEKIIFKTGQGETKLGEIASELGQIPAFLKPQLLAGEGLNDFMGQIYGRVAAISYVKKHYSELSKKYEGLLNETARRVAVRLLLDSTIGKVSVDEAFLKDYYNKNHEQFKRPSQTRASHILLKDEADAKAILEELKKDPSKFAAIAKEKSLCPSGKQNGGDLGLFGEGQMVAEFENACKTAEIGKIIGPVKTNFGWHIIRVDEKRPAGYLKFEEVKDSLAERLLPERQREEYAKFLKGLQAEYKVKIFEEKLNN